MARAPDKIWLTVGWITGAITVHCRVVGIETTFEIGEVELAELLADGVKAMQGSIKARHARDQAAEETNDAA